MDKILQLVEDWGIFGLIAVSFTEASIFIIPPDVLLLPMSTNSPHLALWFGAVTIFSSILGALFGYWLGKKIGPPILKRMASDKMIARAEELYKKYGIMALVVVGITPIPFKVFAILGGILQVPLKLFLIGTIIGRIIRFLPLAAAIFFLGDQVKPYINEITSTGTGFFSILTIGFIIAAVIAARQRYKSRKRSLDG
ncbi:YqaA family protein [Metabacillus sp. 113a]|uniref:YqaA family protein n=1 Tax=Metabacillus sp. 113a TaxID=3404706 RepID=UPI003CEE50AB